MINTEMSNPEMFYSPYGYIEVDKQEYNDRTKELVRFRKTPYKICGTIRKTQLTQHISITLKTFHSTRRVFNFEVNISEKLSDIITKICIEEDQLGLDTHTRWNTLNQYRLISSLSMIKELNPLKSFHEESIKPSQTILLLNINPISFNQYNKGNLIHLDSHNKVAYKMGGDEHQFALTTQAYTSGKHYFEVLLETEPYERSVIIGVTLKRQDYILNPSDVKGLYGFVLSECKKVSNGANGKVELVEYGDITKIGDKVGVMMEFYPSGLDISFFINKVNMGVAFKGLPVDSNSNSNSGKVYFPAVVLGFDGTRVRITNNVGFPSV